MKKQNQNSPLVSVIMPVYNAEEFLVDSINSILNQTYKNIELIIINDKSTDGSLKIITKFLKKYPKIIKLINLKRNLNRGGDACANIGIKQAKGKYIARMDADDISHPKRLERQVNFLEKNSDYFLVGTNAYVIDKKGKIIGEKLEPKNNEDIYNMYFNFHPIIHPSVMYRRFFKGKKFFYPQKYSANNDYYAFFKMICLGYKFANIQEKLLYYRIHNRNDTFMKIKEKFFNTLKIRINMVYKYGYKPTFKQWIINFIQLGLAVILPEKFLFYLYLISKGIIKKEKIINNLKESFRDLHQLFLRKLATSKNY